MSEEIEAEVPHFEENKSVSMLEFEKQIFLDILNTDGLVVCAKGISYNTVVLNLLKVFCDSGNLIIVVNCADYEEKFFIDALNSEHVYVAATTASEREKVYLQGGIQFISTRILVVDLLKKRVPIEHITGVIVLRAHSVIESCQEAFALRLYRQYNKTGFVKAFSNSAESFTYGYGHVEKVMRSIFVKELYLWPRFHVTVINNLKAYEPSVMELQIPMTSTMVAIQTCILDLMNFTCKELKRLNRHLDLQEITVENCVTKKFHKILQHQLDCIWHQLSSTTKQLVQDLKVLRGLMIWMLYNDSVSLYARMKQYRTMEYAMSNAGWILLDTAEQMFKVTKDRVFNKDGEFDPEKSPKWSALLEILNVEIPADQKENEQSSRDAVRVLILCNDSRTCHQLNQYLTLGPERYLFYTALLNEVPVTTISKNYKSFDLKSISNEIIKNKIDKSNKTEEKDMNKSVENVFKKPKSTVGKRFLKDKLSKPEEKKEGGETHLDLSEILNNDVDLEEDFNKTSYILTLTQKHDVSGSEDEQFNFSDMNETQYECFPEMENLDMAKITTEKPIVCIQTFKNENGVLFLEKTLKEFNPNYIVMYHSNVTAIRQIETYEARLRRTSSKRVKVFFLLHAQTVEEQSYLTNLRREKEAFELLIETKSSMVVPEYQDGKSDDCLAIQRQLKQTPEKNTRKAGGQESTENIAVAPKIIVDMREFRSDLPSLIHKRGIEVDPVTIVVGDYILTPDICIERKSISDLIGSLNSGRLYNQCVQMSRYYSKPMLLIEFDQNRPFHLQGHYMVSNEGSNVDITQKLQLLTLHFPKLRIVWSPSPYATAQLFEELKQGKEEPNSLQAAAAGTDSDTPDMDYITDRYNTSIHDFLMKLPGVTSKNIGSIMAKGQNLNHLLTMKQNELKDILGHANDAKLFWDIVHVAHKPVLDDKNAPKGKFNKAYRGRRK